MATAKVTRNGQITIPAQVRQALSVAGGDRVEFVQLEPGRFLFFAVNGSVTDLKGLFGNAAKAVSIEEMNRATAASGGAARGSA